MFVKIKTVFPIKTHLIFVTKMLLLVKCYLNFSHSAIARLPVCGGRTVPFSVLNHIFVLKNVEANMLATTYDTNYGNMQWPENS